MEKHSEKHSDKAMKTIELMGTKPEQWKHADVEFVIAIRPMRTKVPCPTCGRMGHAPVGADGKSIPYPSTKDPKFADGDSYDYGKWQDAVRAWGKLDQQRCQSCYSSRTHRCMREITVMKDTEVFYGVVLWPRPFPSFTSRFKNYERYCCELCSKTLTRSLAVPVVTKDLVDGKYLAMWVGSDCARRFLPGVHTYKDMRPKDPNKPKGEKLLVVIEDPNDKRS